MHTLTRGVSFKFQGARVLPSSGVIWLIGERYDLAKGADKQVDNDKVSTQSGFSEYLFPSDHQAWSPSML